MNRQIIEGLLEEMIEGQKKQLLACGRQMIPHLTHEDLLQPNDFPELENNPLFRYEEGVLAGLQSAAMAIRSSMRASQRSNSSEDKA